MRNNFKPIFGATCLAILVGGVYAYPTPLSPSNTTEEENPESITLTGVVRDFKERSVEGGHPDFESRPDGGFGLYGQNIAVDIGEDEKPVFTGSGRKLRRQYKDSAGNPICWTLFDEDMGDMLGRWGSYDSGGIESSSSYDVWFNDVLGSNMSRTFDLTLDKAADGSYVFDSNESEWCQLLNGFFPIENQLFGNSAAASGAPDRNFHFTFELHTEFTYNEDDSQVFTFRGDDDVWVFIDGKLVIDLGGVHGAESQTVDIDRLGLTSGETYRLCFFFAERHRTQSNFRIQTNLKLDTVDLPTVTAAYD
ncbi:MAG: fibro-slime domain-containing protein [Phycisphaerales bacterium]|jgi:fibro-slime domain-containing protein|nr:fibro-slime domain-containing protein [Phycisphaerales bacterium]